MKLLLDTQVLIWISGVTADVRTKLISAATWELIEDPANDLYFSPVAVWEVAIKNALGRPHFRLDAHAFRRGLLDGGYIELPITSEHAAALVSLPPIHRDPFDRILIAQATFEGITLLTADEVLGRYSGPVRRV